MTKKQGTKVRWLRGVRPGCGGAGAALLMIVAWQSSCVKRFQSGRAAADPAYKDEVDADTRKVQDAFKRGEILNAASLSSFLNREFSCKGRKAFGSPQADKETWGDAAQPIEQWDKLRPLKIFVAPAPAPAGTYVLDSKICPGRCIARIFGGGGLVAQGQDQFGNWAVNVRRIAGQEALVIEKNFLGHEEAATAYDLSKSVVTNRKTAWSYHVCQ